VMPWEYPKSEVKPAAGLLSFWMFGLPTFDLSGQSVQFFFHSLDAPN
jgi:hypothetical protein